MNKQKNNAPLVSIVVITYNSSKYVLETLESIKAQTYQNIELIVTDDCSTDDTVAICRKWIEDNRGRFIRAELVTTDKNSGLPANDNRGLRAAKGEWIKHIAGDDILMPRCIETFISEVNQNPDTYFFSCGIYKLEGEYISEEIYAEPAFLAKNADRQFKYLAIFLNYISGPSMFMNRLKMEELGGFEERYEACEDFPLSVKATSFGYRFQLVPLPLVIYRIHEQSISHKQGSNFLGETATLYFNEILLPLIKRRGMFFLHRHYSLYKKMVGSTSKIARLKISLWMRLTDPYVWIFKYHKLFHKRVPWPSKRIKMPEPIIKSDIMLIE